MNLCMYVRVKLGALPATTLAFVKLMADTIIW